MGAPFESGLTYTKNFEVQPALHLFYTGGPAKLFPSGECVACACNDEIKVVALSNGSVKTTLPGDTEDISALAISPDGQSLFAASRSLSIKHWNVPSASAVRTWKAHEGPVADMALDSSGGLLATASVDRAVFVWDVDGGYCTHAFRGHTGIVTAVLFHPNTHRLQLFSASDDATVRVWDLVTKRCVAVLKKHFSTVTSLAVSTNGWALLSAGRDKVVNVWDLRDNSLQSTVPVYESLESICVIPDNSGLPGSSVPREQVKKSGSAPVRFLTAGERGVIRIWKSDGAVCLYEEKHSKPVSRPEKEDSRDSYVSATLLPGQKGVMIVTADQRLLFYESAPTDDGSAQLKLTKRLIGRQDEVIDLKFVGQEENMLAVATNIEQVRLYDVATMTCLRELDGHTDIVLSLDSAVSSAGTAFLASAGKDHTLRIWNVETGSCIAVATGHMAAVGAVAFAKKTLNFVVTGSSDNTVKVWNLEGVLDAASTETPSKLSTKAVVAAHEKDINSIAVSPNDALLCTGSQDRTACIWKLPSLARLTTLRGHKRGVWSVEFSPVDQAVLTASADKTIRIWAITDGSCLRTFEGHTASVLRAMFISRGTQVVSAGADGILKLWTVKTSECINTFDHHEDKVWALDVSKTKSLATGGSDSVVNIWRDCTKKDEEEAAQKEAEEVLKGQDLVNALSETDYVKAVQLAFELKRPMKLLEVFKEMFSKREANDEVLRVLKGLGKEHFRLLLEYAREWNTKSKFCHIAQRLINTVLSLTPAAEIIELPGLRELLEGILPYTQRHFSRIDRLARSTFLLDYTLSTMSVLTPPEGLSTEVKERATPNKGFAQEIESEVWRSGTVLGGGKLAKQNVQSEAGEHNEEQNDVDMAAEVMPPVDEEVEAKEGKQDLLKERVLSIGEGAHKKGKSATKSKRKSQSEDMDVDLANVVSPIRVPEGVIPEAGPEKVKGQSTKKKAARKLLKQSNVDEDLVNEDGNGTGGGTGAGSIRKAKTKRNISGGEFEEGEQHTPLPRPKKKKNRLSLPDPITV